MQKIMKTVLWVEVARVTLGKVVDRQVDFQ